MGPLDRDYTSHNCCPWPKGCCFGGYLSRWDMSCWDRSENQDGGPGLWFAGTFLSSLEQLNWIQRNLTESKILTSSTKFVFSVRSENKDDSFTICGPLASIPDKLFILMLCEGIPMYKWLIRVDFRQNLLRSMHSMSYQFLFRANPSTMMAIMASDWLRHLLFLPTAGFFGLIRWQRWLSCPLLDRSSFYFSPTT